MKNYPHKVVVIGGGSDGLMATEVLVKSGAHVDVYDAMPSGAQVSHGGQAI